MTKCNNLVEGGIIAFMGNNSYHPGKEILKRDARFSRSRITGSISGIPFSLRSDSMALSGSPGTKT